MLTIVVAVGCGLVVGGAAVYCLIAYILGRAFAKGLNW